jgi:hypothetical protein
MALPDSFTNSNGTSLESHDALWVKNTQYTGVLEIQSNKATIKSSPAANACYVYDQAPSSADYDVTGDWSNTTTSGSGGVIGRASKTADTFYLARHASSNDIELYKFVAGTPTSLGSAASGYTANATMEIKLSMSGSTIKVYCNGVQKISVTDTAITAAGYAGIRFGASTSGFIDNFNFTGSVVSHGSTGDLTSGDAAVSGSATRLALHSATGALSADAASVSGSASRSAGAVSHSATGDLAASAATVAASATRSAANPAITTDPLKNNTGTVLANETGVTACVYAPSTGALVVRLTGQTTDASGVLHISDAALVSGTTYWTVIELASGALGFTKKAAA